MRSVLLGPLGIIVVLLRRTWPLRDERGGVGSAGTCRAKSSVQCHAGPVSTCTQYLPEGAGNQHEGLVET
jgi:hypothetical protein